MMDQAKERAALELVDQQLMTAMRPVVCCSFGKDSIVVLHLCLRFRKVPVIFVRHARFHEKFAHAEAVATRWDLEMHDLAPIGAFEYQHGPFFDVISAFSTGAGGRLFMLAGCRERRPDEERYYCALHELILQPKGTVEYPWDVTFLGHKACDAAHFADRAEPVAPVFAGRGPQPVFPLHDWTDEDVWAYIRQYDLPYDRRWYEQKDASVNPDELPTCYRCLDGHHAGEQVWCPKINAQIASLAIPSQAMALRRQTFRSTLKFCTVTGNGEGRDE